jgi:hypothetical protein
MTTNATRDNQLSRYFCQNVGQSSKREEYGEWLRREDHEREKKRVKSGAYKRTSRYNQGEDYSKGNHRRYTSHKRTKLTEEEVIKRDEKREEELMSFYGINKEQI